jgi:predicted nuclease of restriction endonuclease-like RecB superfamily
MLPRDLLVVWKRKGAIGPKYLRDTQQAETILQMFTRFQGKKYKELLQELEDAEEKNFKVVRGLSTLLERRCAFKPSSEIKGRDVRMFLFEKGFVTSAEARKRLLEEAAQQFQVSPQTIEEAFFSDLEEEQVLTDVALLSPDELVRWYNLSLMQTLLFDALELTFWVKDNYQHIFRQMKYLGLMYEIDDGVKVTGPSSLFKKNRKYGTAMAKLLPVITNAHQWKLQAKIETLVGGEPRVLDFTLDSGNNVLLPHHADPIVHFDSEVEAQFYRDFTALNLGWDLVREPDVVKAGNYVVIPDFGFSKDGLQHYVEIVGFWTPEYLQRKLAKLKETNVPITVIVNETLSCKKEDFPGEVLFYKNRIPMMEIVTILREMEEQQIALEMSTLQEISISEDAVSLQQKAKELCVHPKTLMRMEIPGYHVIGEQLVSQRFLEKVKGEIRPPVDYQTVEEILAKYELTMGVLEYMGYRVIWEGLCPSKVVKRL